MSSMTTTFRAPTLPWRCRPLVSMLERIALGTLELTTPEGLVLRFGTGDEPSADLRLESWGALRKIMRSGVIGLAECYRDGEISCSNLTRLLRMGICNQEIMDSVVRGKPLLRLLFRARHLLRSNTRKGSKRNIQAHYDLGNDFYRLWLDPSMTYSSACFANGYGGDLQQAQIEKYSRILELTGARPGQSILEIGCGWGGFAEFAASRGISVHGITLSREQLRYAKERIDRAGLSHQASFELRDYRDINESFDHIVSIEMLEAVGESYWNTYFNQLRNLLKPGGNAVIQVITIDDERFESYRKHSDFIQQYIFPGGMLPPQSKLLELTESSGLNFESLDSFGKDYAETLRRWSRKFEQQLDHVRAQGFDDAFIQLWRFYLAYCEAGFDENRIDVVHLRVSREKGIE